ncbi:MAG: DUF6263 family protein [Ginsengibacter sp.]
MKKTALITASAFVVSMATFAQNNGTLNLPKGQKYVVENKLVTKSTSEMQGQSMESNVDVTSTYAIEVKDLKDNNYNMTNSISAIKMNMSTMGQNINFDSDKKEDMNGEMGSNVKDYINHPKDVLMDKSGNVIIAKQKDTAKEKEATNPTEMIMKQMGDPEAQGYGAKMAFLPIPKNAKAGAAWKDSSLADGIKKVTNYSIKEIKGNTATISISGIENRDVKMQMQGMEINTKTNGKFTGEETVDITTGVVLQNNLTADSAGTIYVMGQEIPTTATVTSVTTVKPM